MLRRVLTSLLGLSLLAPAASATWSIVCVNLETREVAVASATCLANFDLRSAVPVIFAGEGAAAAQSFIDSSGENKRLIYFSFRDTEETPGEILARLANQDPGHQTRQYGIVNFSGDPVTFTGSRDGAAATGVTGRIGDILYAVQGNVLTGDEVVFAAAQAFRDAKGDMGQKLMAAMEAARALGGDGRCSCDAMHPTSCGVPPPSFDKSAHAGVVVIARVGDQNGGCSPARGCANGDYYLNLNVRGDDQDPDPVVILKKRYDRWRYEHLGRPDGVLSRVQGVKDMPADGVTERRIRIELNDIDEHRIRHGGALVEVLTEDGLAPLAEVGKVYDRGDGSYEFTLRAGTRPGVDRFLVRVTDVLPSDPSDVLVATLWPPIEVATLDTELLAAPQEVPAGAGAELSFVVNRPTQPGALYRLVARWGAAQGETLGLLAGGGVVVDIPRSPFFPGAPGMLDASGRAETTLQVPPGVLVPWIGRELEITAWVLDGGPLERTRPARVRIRP